MPSLPFINAADHRDGSSVSARSSGEGRFCGTKSQPELGRYGDGAIGSVWIVVCWRNVVRYP
jgi:hypothetical protein